MSLRWIHPDELKEIKKLDLLTYLQTYNPQELVHVHGGEYTTRTHDSLKISNGMWHWFSRGVSHTSALDYLIHVEGRNFLDACEYLIELTKGRALSDRAMPELPREKPRNSFTLPRKHKDNKEIMRYLMGRGISPSILQSCISSGILFESVKHHSAVFIGRNADGKPCYAAYRSTFDGEEAYKGEGHGSDKRFSFALTAQQPSGTLYVTESAIDALSVATLLSWEGRPWQNAHILSLGSVSMRTREAPRLPLALEQYLKDHTEIGRIILCLDNDVAGRTASERLKALLATYEAVDRPPPKGKDYNEYLQSKCRARERAALSR